MAAPDKNASPDLASRHDLEERSASDTLLVVGIGASAGGLKALEEFFSSLPDTCEMAFVVVVHLSPEHDSSLATILQRHTKMPVSQVTDHVLVEAGRVYVIPPEHNLSMTDGHIELTERSRPGHLPIDLFFRTLAETHGARSVAVILSGKASDGSAGIGRIRERGGLTIAQLPDEAEYDAMPQAAIDTGNVDRILRIAELAAALQEYQSRLERTTLRGQSDPRVEMDAAALASIFEHVSEQTGHDFTHYKRATIRRRLMRRLLVTETEDLAEYLEHLQNHAEETQNLLKDLLLTVTNFFRDPDAFAALEKDVIPNLFEGKDSSEAVRAWTCGCSTGEEAYSIAMLLVEEADRVSSGTPSRIFASDISEDALRVARAGYYGGDVDSDVSPERLSRFFHREADGFRIKKYVREMITFAAHNLLQDPPFSRLDLVVCRNLLIYLDRSVHDRIFELFHYSLLPGGFLFLGDSESIESKELFSAVDERKGLYQRRDGTSVIRPSISMPSTSSTRENARGPEARRATRLPDVESLHRSLIARYGPPSLIVSANHQVVHSLGGGEEYLQFRPGRPTQNVFKVVREELRLELRTALYRALRKDESTRSRAIPVRVDGALRHVELIVAPISEGGYAKDHVHVVIREATMASPPDDFASETSGDGSMEASASDAAGPRTPDEKTDYTARLEEELDRVKEQLHVTTQEHDVVNEEMTASNEEMQSINEELQATNEELTSTTEELTTSKAEIQSANEKLSTLNADLEAKVAEVNRINSDLRNLIDATEIATIFLDGDLRVKRYTPHVQELFEMGENGVERRLIDLPHHLNGEDFAADAARVLRDHMMVEREVRHTISNQWFLVRYRPYYGNQGAVDGVVITFVDITQKKQHDEQLEALVGTLEHLLSARAEQIKTLASELLIAEQTERQRIAQILHDELQQLLYAFQLKIGALAPTLANDQAARLGQATELIDRAMGVARTLTVELSPPVLKSEDVGVTLEWLALQMEEMHNLRVDVAASAPIRLPKEQRTLVYLIARELLFNVVKHAGTDHARMNLVQNEHHLVLIVEDEGVGFDMTAGATPDPKKQAVFGLESVRQRLDNFGGRLEMEAAPGDGTRATLFLPLGDEDTAADPSNTLDHASQTGIDR